jgi:hypothetical protein
MSRRVRVAAVLVTFALVAIVAGAGPASAFDPGPVIDLLPPEVNPIPPPPALLSPPEAITQMLDTGGLPSGTAAPALENSLAKLAICSTLTSGSPLTSWCTHGVLGQTDQAPGNPFGLSTHIDFGSWPAVAASLGWTTDMTDFGITDGGPYHDNTQAMLLTLPTPLVPGQDYEFARLGGERFHVRIHGLTETDGYDLGITDGAGNQIAVTVNTPWTPGPHMLVDEQVMAYGHCSSGIWLKDETDGGYTSHDWDTCTFSLLDQASNFIPGDLLRGTAFQIGHWFRHAANIGADWTGALAAIAGSIGTGDTYTIPFAPPTVATTPPYLRPNPVPDSVPALLQQVPGVSIPDIAPGTGSSDPLQNLGDRISHFFDNLGGNVSSVGDQITGGISNDWHWAVDQLTNASNAVGDALGAALDNLKTTIGDGFNKAASWGTTAWSTMFDWQAKIRDAIKSMTDGLGHLLDQAKTGILNIPAGVLGAIGTAFWPTIGMRTLIRTATHGTFIDIITTTVVDGGPAFDPTGSTTFVDVLPPFDPENPVPDPPVPPGGGDPVPPTFEIPPPAIIPPACGISFHIPAPVNNTFYGPNPSDSGCPGNGAGHSRTYGDNQAGDVFGHRQALRSFALFLLMFGFIIKLARAMPWAKEDDLSGGLMLASAGTS